MHKKIAIIGSSGQLGSDLVQAFDTRAIPFDHSQIEITNEASVKAALLETGAELVINAVGFTKTVECEKNPELAYSINSEGAGILSKVAHEMNAGIVYVSSDYVFDGKKSSYTEEDIPHPLNVYGASKLEGEKLTAKNNPRYYIARSSWLFGLRASHKGYDFPRIMLRKALEKKPLEVVNDQFGSPTFTADLSKKILEITDARAPFGIYHITNPGEASWFQFAKKVFDLSGVSVDLRPVPTTEAISGIKRPARSVMRNENLLKNGFKLARPWDEALEQYIKDLKQTPEWANLINPPT